MEDFSENIVLLVDDNSENIEFLNEALNSLYTIMAATDGYIALEIVERYLPDLILLDVVMPGMDGYEVCRKLKAKEETRDIPVIFLTGRKNLDDKTLGFELGAVDYITKPFEIIEIKARVKNQMIVKRAQKFLEYQNRYLESEVHNRSKELSQTQADLEESEEKFRKLFEKSSNGIAFVQPCFNENQELCDFEYLDVNPVFLSLYNLSINSDILFKKEKELFPEIEDKWINLFKSTAEQGDSGFFEVYHSSLDKYFNGSSFKPQKNKDYFCIILNDMTEQMLYQKELLKEKNKAEESDRLKSAFLANISHEIRTPLNGIIGFTHLMKEEGASQSGNQYYEIVSSCSKNLISIIDEIIDFARIESNSFNLDYNGVSINLLIHRCAEKYRQEIDTLDKKDLEIIEVLPLPEGQDIFITDKNRLMKIFDNLLNNAVKFTNNGKIFIGYTIDNINSIDFFVKDTGIGISQEAQKYIFQSFRQEKEGYNRLHGGIGLGLAISKKIVEQMDGVITLESQQNKGSNFSFSFNTDGLNPSEQNKEKWSKKISINEILYGKTVIILEDLAVAKENIKRLLKLKGIHVITADSIMELNKTLREHPETDAIIISQTIMEQDPYDMIKLFKTPMMNLGRILYLKNDQPQTDLFQNEFHVSLNSPLDPVELYNSIGKVIYQK